VRIQVEGQALEKEKTESYRRKEEAIELERREARLGFRRETAKEVLLSLSWSRLFVR